MTAPVPVRFRAADGHELVGDFHGTSGEPAGSVLVASALGVPRRYYAAFASYLAEGGLQALAFDYRGVGDSRPADLRGHPGRLQDWADYDMPAAAAELRRRAPDAPLLWLGHSVGGQLFGLVGGLDVRAALFVASHSVYWRGFPSLAGKLGVGALYHGVIPLLTRTFGRLPMRTFGQGEDIPVGVARQWAAWGRDPHYVLGFARRERGVDHFGYDGPMRFYAIEDDRYAPPPTVEALHGFYPRARKELKLVRPADLGVKKLGHFGPFRKTHRETLWPELRAWLLARARGEPVEFAAAIG